jgi:hypothetical protein
MVGGIFCSLPSALRLLRPAGSVPRCPSGKSLRHNLSKLPSPYNVARTENSSSVAQKIPLTCIYTCVYYMPPQRPSGPLFHNSNPAKTHMPASCPQCRRGPLVGQRRICAYLRPPEPGTIRCGMVGGQLPAVPHFAFCNSPHPPASASSVSFVFQLPAAPRELPRLSCPVRVTWYSRGTMSAPRAYVFRPRGPPHNEHCAKTLFHRFQFFFRARPAPTRKLKSAGNSRVTIPHQKT